MSNTRHINPVPPKPPVKAWLNGACGEMVIVREWDGAVLGPAQITLNGNPISQDQAEQLLNEGEAGLHGEDVRIRLDDPTAVIRFEGSEGITSYG